MDHQKIRIMVVNGQSASASAKHTALVVERATKKAIEAGVDVIGWCEVSDVSVLTLTKLIDPKWHAKQYGDPEKDTPQSGLAISWDMSQVELDNFSRDVGSKAGSGIRERSILSASLHADWNARIHDVHAPPKRTPIIRASYMRKALKKIGIIFGDTNFIWTNLRRMDPRRKIVSVGVLAIIVPRRFWVSKPVAVDVGSDHKAFYVDIEPKRVRRKRRARKEKS